MTDISKCEGRGCRWRQYCLRHTAKSSERQSWFCGTPELKETGECDYFIMNGKFREQISTSPTESGWTAL